MEEVVYYKFRIFIDIFNCLIKSSKNILYIEIFDYIFKLNI